MTIDELIKLFVFGGITFSIVGISFQFMRILSKTVDMMQDLRKTLANANDLSSQLLEDYKSVKSVVSAISNGLGNINDAVVQPVVKASKGINRFFGKRKSRET